LRIPRHPPATFDPFPLLLLLLLHLLLLLLLFLLPASRLGGLPRRLVLWVIVCGRTGGAKRTRDRMGGDEVEFTDKRRQPYYLDADSRRAPRN